MHHKIYEVRDKRGNTFNMNFQISKITLLNSVVFVVLIFTSITPAQMLSDQITAAVVGNFPDCVVKNPLASERIGLSGSPMFRGSFKCGKQREIRLRAALTASEDEKHRSLRMFSMRSIMPPSRAVSGIGENSGMFTMNGRVELQFSKGNVIFVIENNFPGVKTKDAYYYHRAPESEEHFLIEIGKAIEKAVPERDRILTACKNDFAWPAVDYGVSSEERLFTSIVRGDHAAAKMLIGLGANVEANFGQTLFRTTGDESLKPIHIAIAMGCFETFTALLDAGASVNSVSAKNEAPLMFAVAAKDVEMVKLLIQKGAKVDTRSEYGKTAPFFLFQSYLQRRIGNTVEQKPTSSVEKDLGSAKVILSVLKENGADLNEHEPRDGNTLFTILFEHCGGSDWCIDMSELLLDFGLEINAVDNDGRTALFKAASKINPSQSAKVFEHLLANGADPNIKTKSGETVISYLNYHAAKDEYYGEYYKQMLVFIKLAEAQKKK